MLTTDGRTKTQSSMITFWNCSLNLVKKGKIEFCLIFDDFRNDVITRAIDVDFLHFYNQQKYMIIGFRLIYNLNLSWLEQNFSTGYKLLHVFGNTLYMYWNTQSAFATEPLDGCLRNLVGMKNSWSRTCG